MAACDLDSDHIPTPDWRPLGTVTCGRCGEPAEATGSGGLAHVDRARDGDHTPDPWAR